MLATPSDALREFAWNAGMDQPERAWLLHEWDVWVANPHYHGPSVPHPENDWEPTPVDGGPLGARIHDFQDDDIPF